MVLRYASVSSRCAVWLLSSKTRSSDPGMPRCMVSAHGGAISSYRPTVIRVPTLITVGRYDEIAPPCAETMQRGIPGSELRVFEESSHTAHLEETDAYLSTIREFLRHVEAGATAH